MLTSSLVLDRLLEKSSVDYIALAYHYCDYQNGTEQAPESILASLLKQLVEKNETIPKEIVTLHETCQKLEKALSLNDLTKTLIEVCRDMSSTFVVVDALDECSQRNRLISSLKKMKEAGIKVFCTSRPLPDLQEAFGTDLKVEIKAADSDVKSYVISRFEENEDLEALTPGDVKEKLVTKLIEQANGMYYILASLHFQAGFTDMEVGFFL
jgi:hypothetical protein